MKKLKNYLQTNKAKAIFALILLASLTSQIKPIFIRGSFYKNETTGQFILIFGDAHHDPHKYYKNEQKDLIENIKELAKNNSLIALLEDPENGIFCETTLPLLHQRLIEEKIETKNIECRFINIMNVNNLNFMQSFEKPLLDLKKEHNLNVENIKTEINELPSIAKNFNFSKEGIKGLVGKFEFIKNRYEQKKVLDMIENINNIYPGLSKVKNISIEENISINDLIKGSIINIHSDLADNYDGQLIDANIIFNALKNHDKKIIIICAGIAHTLPTEIFFNSLGYKLIDKFELGNLGIDLKEKNVKELSKKASKVLKSDPERFDLSILFNRVKRELIIDELKNKIIEKVNSNNESLNNLDDNNKYIKTNNNFKRINFETLYDDEPIKIFTTKEFLDKDVCSRELNDLSVGRIRWFCEQNKKCIN